MLKCINQWGFPESTPIEQLFEYSQAAGYDAVELNLNPSGSVGLTLDTTATEAEEVGRLARKYGIKLRSLSTGLLWGAPLSSQDEDQREQGKRIVSKQLELANVLGMDTILVVPGVVNAEISYNDCYRRSQEEIGKLVPLAERLQVSIGIENVWNKFLLSPLEIARYIDEFNSAYIGSYFDVGNVLQFGFPEQWIRILGPRIKKIHVKDFNTKVGNINGFVTLLSGDVNWPEVVAALREIGYSDTITAELSPFEKAPLQMIYDTARHLQFITDL
ncbi:sugar phosphate isomerase/epimerase [Paenibacillus frigoriresistens]|uniref:sugar phosphate isomerase/epimerase family protein n=1 Tax=Paenibacillus alginolyticus TaxID=59839 RepID=UPI001563CD78|nr:sugar phosphate isomerase/epimerase family protein [Paenibacillus frigoriresistens]NRF95727.1 sugar phosphate isomerase/epimerase [Paenibacillus frigoriresistens]